jgi:Spermine/spermidine synthase domain
MVAFPSSLAPLARRLPAPGATRPGLEDSDRFAPVPSLVRRESPATQPTEQPSRALQSRLLLASALMLFVELALIRWTGSNVLHLSYFSNFVLLGSFLGVGLGFLRARSSFDLSPWWPVLLVLLVGFVLAFPVQVDQSSEQIIFFTGVEPTGLPAWVTLPLIFVAVAAVTAGLGEGVARLFPRFRPLEAYRLDLAGSLLGIGAFTLLSFLHAPPVAWGCIAAVAFLALHWPRPRLWSVVALGLLVVLLGAESLTANVSWSPYYKVKTVETGDSRTEIWVNGIPHQASQRIDGSADKGLREAPYQRVPGDPPRNVLIIGAGNGTDVALALAHDAGSVDAVEIDPRLLEIGRERHPNRPYDDPRVRVHIDDGRAFLQRTGTKYDLVIFALPDSLTLVSGASSLRLESYLFTREAIAMARDHLAPGGVFAMYNSYRKDWLIDRYAGTVAAVFGHSPCIDSVGGDAHYAAVVAALNPGDQRCAAVWRPASAAVPASATDDHPFPYLLDRGIPRLYLLVLGAMLAFALLSVRVVGGPLRQLRPYRDLFFMGAAFLLLETKNVTGFALLFGTTWVVNAIVFAGVLLTVLAAVEVSRRVRLPRPPILYAALALSLALAWLVPADGLLGLAVPVRLVVAVAIAFAPIFCANLVFAQRFVDTSGSTAAFGANLLGALLGGSLEYLSLIVGYHGLLVLAGLLYLAAFVIRPRTRALVPA